VRVVIAEDSVLLREGLSRLLVEAGIDVVAATGEAEEFLRLVDAQRPGRRGGRCPHATDLFG
jgi:DNA-binding NarL/FixJ family response regulator